jgi:hypothetical protein
MKLFGKAEPDVEPVQFHVYNGADIYGSLKAQAMTEEFASDFKETNHYYFAYDEEFLPYIIQLHGKLPEGSLKIQAYLYDESGEAPEPVTFYGMSAPIEEDIRKYAMEGYNEIWGEELVTEDNFSDYFGEYYLDTTKKPVSGVSETVYSFFAIALMAAAMGTVVLIWNLHSPKFKKSRATLKAWPKEKLLALDEQLQDCHIFAYEKEQLYLTNDSIITGAEGFEVFSYGDVDRVYEAITMMKKRLMAETKNHRYHTLILKKGGGRRKEEVFRELAGQVKKHIEDKKEELEERFLTAEYHMDLEHTDEEAILQVSAALEQKPSNLILGVIGALFASLLGVGLWVVIGQVGFVAGIAGFVMLKLALGGYQKLGGSLDKKGAVICLVITAGMIAGANLLDYAVSITRAYFQYETSLETLVYVFSNFGKLMSDMEMWSGFFTDLAIGFALSVWSASGIINAIIRIEK